MTSNVLPSALSKEAFEDMLDRYFISPHSPHPGFVWHAGSNAAAYFAHGPLGGTQYGKCPLRMGAPTESVTLACEIRYPKGPRPMARDILRIAAAFCAQRVREISSLTTVELHSGHGPEHSMENTMQRLFTIEVRVDFRDESKIPLFTKAIQQAARHVYAQSALLGDGVKPEVVIYSHDYFSGHADIALFDDDILDGTTAITEAGNSALSAGEAALTTGAPAAPVAKTEPTPVGFSDELMNALK